MRISDWSSDVCSSDLAVHPYAGVTMEWLNDIYLQQVGFPAEPGPDNDLLREALQKHIADLKPAAVSAFFNGKPYVAAGIADLASQRPQRSDERRAGKGWCRTDRTRRTPAQ